MISIGFFSRSSSESDSDDDELFQNPNHRAPVYCPDNSSDESDSDEGNSDDEPDENTTS